MLQLRRVSIVSSQNATPEEAIKLRCPGCLRWAEIDDDQFHGRVSLVCDSEDGGCGWHETHNLAATGEWV